MFAWLEHQIQFESSITCRILFADSAAKLHRRLAELGEGSVRDGRSGRADACWDFLRVHAQQGMLQPERHRRPLLSVLEDFLSLPPMTYRPTSLSHKMSAIICSVRTSYQAIKTRVSIKKPRVIIRRSLYVLTKVQLSMRPPPVR